MNGVDANSLELAANVNGSQHSSVGRRLFSVGLHLHAAGYAGVGFTAGEIGNVDEGVVLGGLDVADTEGVNISAAGTNLRGSVVGDNLFFLGLGRLLSLLYGGLKYWRLAAIRKSLGRTRTHKHTLSSWEQVSNKDSGKAILVNAEAKKRELVFHHFCFHAKPPPHSPRASLRHAKHISFCDQ